MEDYDLNLHIPRIFPCFDTICQWCIIEMFTKRQDELTCPQCRAVHKTWGKGFKAFRQNKYIIPNLQNDKEEKTSSGPRFIQCETHKRKLTLFCREDTCMRAICSKCLTQNHKFHDVQDIEDRHEMYSERVKKRIDNVNEKKNNLLKAKDEMTKEFDAAQTEMESTRNEIIRIVNYKFNKIKRHCETMKANNAQNLQRKIDCLNEKLTTLKDIQRDINAQYRKVYDLHLDNALNESANEDLNLTIVNVEYKQSNTPEVWKQMASDMCGSMTSKKRKLNISSGCGTYTLDKVYSTQSQQRCHGFDIMVSLSWLNRQRQTYIL